MKWEKGWESRWGQRAKERGGAWAMFRHLTRRKQVDSNRERAGGGQQLANAWSVPQLVALGAGVYVLVGTVARENAGPALTNSFLIAGIAAALSAFCYTELSSQCPSAGSAYHYSYIGVGERVAWIIGWALILEYTIGGSTVARGISRNLALVFGGKDSLPSFMARIQIPGTDIVVDPCAAILVLLVTTLLCIGIKKSTLVQGIITINVCVLLFVIIAGGYLGFKTGWVGYIVAGGILSNNRLAFGLLCNAWVSVGTLLAFTIVAVSILILRYVPPSEVLLPSFLQQSIDSVSFHHNFQNNGEEADSSGIICSNQDQDDGTSQEVSKESSDYPLIAKESNKDTEGSPSPNSPPRSSSSTARSTSMSRTSKNSFVGMKNSLRSKSPPYYILSWLQTTCTYRGCWI
ncbi:cationic amino acid transporter 2, vacuolar-like isoform X1 [Zingiber officinale]|uniref:cationic amino acid transporter 2, vacuolar-like isoform X1 n=1 Tax=Zingiber officinale TaxID=94328 RepID=UPI001C4AD624|nr:cationic amino acid transporter 2, vacuolar-like isoform X1 [Zingiber officinale]